jgi:hypothetical protein
MPSTGLDSRAAGAEHCDEACFTVTTVTLDTIADFLSRRLWTTANSGPAATRGLCEMAGSRILTDGGGRGGTQTGWPHSRNLFLGET